MKKQTAFVLVSLVLVGCSYLKSTTNRSVATNPTNGVVTVSERTDARGWTLLDANASLVKFSNRSGYTTNGTWGPGTYASGVNEASNTTNLVDIIGAVAAGVVHGLKP